MQTGLISNRRGFISHLICSSPNIRFYSKTLLKEVCRSTNSIKNLLFNVTVLCYNATMQHKSSPAVVFKACKCSEFPH